MPFIRCCCYFSANTLIKKIHPSELVQLWALGLYMLVVRMSRYSFLFCSLPVDKSGAYIARFYKVPSVVFISFQFHMFLHR